MTLLYIEALHYATISHPDIAYATSSQYMDKPSKLHWQACKKVLCFLKGTISYGLQFNPGDAQDLIAFSDAD